MTKTTYRRVLALYESIASYEDWDSDYWSCGGNDFIFQVLLKFEGYDWIALEADLIYWSTGQLEILSGALIEGDRHYDKNLLIDKRVYFYVIICLLTEVYSDELTESINFITMSNRVPVAMLTTLKSRVQNKIGELSIAGVDDSYLKNFIRYRKMIEMHITRSEAEQKT